MGATPFVPVPSSADGVVSKRVSTGAIAGGATVELVVPWDVPFVDAAYTVVPAVAEGTVGVDTLRYRRIVDRTAANVTVRITNDDALNARTGTIHLIAHRAAA